MCVFMQLFCSATASVIDLILYDNVCVCIGLIDTDNISAFSVCFQVEGLAWVVSITCCCCEKIIGLWWV